MQGTKSLDLLLNGDLKKKLLIKTMIEGTKTAFWGKELERGKHITNCTFNTSILLLDCFKVHLSSESKMFWVRASTQKSTGKSQFEYR